MSDKAQPPSKRCQATDCSWCGYFWQGWVWHVSLSEHTLICHLRIAASSIISQRVSPWRTWLLFLRTRRHLVGENKHKPEVWPNRLQLMCLGSGGRTRTLWLSTDSQTQAFIFSGP